MDKQIRNGLPQECLFINADKEIMRIEYGKAGFTRSKLSTENEAANREIVNSYNERHGITADQVEMMHRGALIGWHESCEKSKDGTKEYHNAVFVGCDENGVPRHAHKRGLYTEGTGFKGNVDSCDPSYSFHHIGTSSRLYVFEAPIDLLSYITLHPQDWQKHSYVALCGVSEYVMFKLLELYPHLQHVILCLDHDEAGIEASDKYQDMLTAKGISCERELPMHKDWNEDIKSRHGLPAIPAQEHPQPVVKEEICRQLMESGLPSQCDCSADALSILHGNTRFHLHWGHFTEADACLKEICYRCIVGAAREYSQMDKSVSIADVQERLCNGFKTYENRMRLKTRLNLIEAEIKSLRRIERAVNAGEKENLAECYEQIAAHGLKGAISLEIHRQKVEQSQTRSPVMA